MSRRNNDVGEVQVCKKQTQQTILLILWNFKIEAIPLKINYQSKIFKLSFQGTILQNTTQIYSVLHSRSI
jgi:hypothetical protein